MKLVKCDRCGRTCKDNEWSSGYICISIPSGLGADGSFTDVGIHWEDLCIKCTTYVKDQVKTFIVGAINDS